VKGDNSNVTQLTGIMVGYSLTYSDFRDDFAEALILVVFEKMGEAGDYTQSLYVLTTATSKIIEEYMTV